MNRTQTVRLFAVGLSLALPSLGRAADVSYHSVATIPIPGASSWDYSSVDPAGRRLYVSHGTEVVVIDIDKDAIVGTISNTPGVHGFVAAPELGRGVASDGRENKASIVDLKTLETIVKLDTGGNPDGLVYEPAHQEAYLFNGRGNSATVIDVKNAKVVATIELGGKPEFPTADPEAGKVYDNLEDKSEVVEIDTKTHTVLNHWPLAPGAGPSGMAIDTAHHRLFCGCGESKTMVMMDGSSGKVITSVPIGDGVDANSFDPGTQLAFASCRDGTTTIAHEDSPDKLTVVQTLKTESGARTMTLDTKTHKIYMAVGQRNVPNSFHVLVFAP